MTEDVTYATYFLIGWDLSYEEMEMGPGLII